MRGAPVSAALVSYPQGQGTHLQVRVNAGRADRLGQDDAAALRLVRDEDGRGRDAVLVRDRVELRVRQQRRVCVVAGSSAIEGCPSSGGKSGRTGGAERAVSLHQDAALVAPRLEFVLRVEGMELDLRNPLAASVSERKTERRGVSRTWLTAGTTVHVFSSSSR